jgi:hypothetical protein
MLKGSLEHSWRWRESNPRPSVPHQGFSGCSLLRFSQPRRSRKQDADRLSRCSMSRLAPRPGQAVILLADARHRVGGIPGLTASNSPQAARARSVRIGLALIDVRSQDFRGHNRNPRPASPGSTTEVETVHPLWSCAAGMPSAVYEPYTYNPRSPTAIPGGRHKGPRGRWRWPKRARGGRPAGSEPVQWAESPPS